jgi:hypothetical protein
MNISLRLDDELSRRVTALAQARGISKSELIRACLEQYLTSAEQEPTAWELGQHLFGRFDSGRSDLSVRAGEIAKEHIYARRTKKSRR